MLAQSAGIPSCPERERWVILLMDEMNIKDGLVFEKHTGINGSTCLYLSLYSCEIIHHAETLIGFTDMGYK
jgi:hypothetical protein